VKLSDIIHALTDHQIAPLDVRISSAVIDSRQAVEGSLFIALPGERVDGHDFVQAAFDNGAQLALIDHASEKTSNILDLRNKSVTPDTMEIGLPLCLLVENTLSALHTLATFWRQKHPVRTIGITGSVGKTSTKELTASLLSKKYKVLKNPGNRNNEIGLPLTLLELDDFHERAVLEMGFYVPGEIHTLCEIAQPHVGVVTNIGTVHAERAGSQEVIAQGKAELVESLPSAPVGTAILNMDDSWVRSMAEKTKAQCFTYGIEGDADLTASDIKSHGLDGISCTLNYQGEAHDVSSPLLGKFSAYTILRAAAVALTEGLEWETIKSALATSRMELRMRQMTLPNGAIVLDDTYNASPASTIAALKLLGELEGRHIAVLGDMLELGHYEQSGHQSVGIAAANTADYLVLVGERSKITADAALKNGFSEKHLKWYPDSEQAAQPAADMIQNGDVILIKGSNSMRMDKIINALKGSNS
jgi:UDP-N-acetylmuramoyl-tripeptide--D-alanyl-D-alanine ligase